MKQIINCPNCGTRAATLHLPDPLMPASSDQQWVAAFVKDRCRAETGARVSAQAFRDAYLHWATAAGAPMLAARRLGIEVAKIPGIGHFRTNTTRYYDGIRLRQG